MAGIEERNSRVGTGIIEKPVQSLGIVVLSVSGGSEIPSCQNLADLPAFVLGLSSLVVLPSILECPGLFKVSAVTPIIRDRPVRRVEVPLLDC